MKRHLSLLALLLAATVNAQNEDCPPPPPGTQYSPCPQAPPGFCPYIEAFALTDVYTVPVAFIEVRVPGFNQKPLAEEVRLEFEQEKGAEYEIQFTRDLAAPMWIAYARWKANKTDLNMTDCPIYDCEPGRFFRVMAKPHDKFWKGGLTPTP